MSSPFPQRQVLVGFSNNPFDDHTAWPIAAPGTLGPVGTWTDITNDVHDVDIARGRQHETAAFPPGTCTITLKNDVNVGQYNPWNASSPYNGKILPLKKVQVREIWNGVTYNRYTGFVVAWPIYWPDEVSQEAAIVCEDAFRIFNLALLASNAYSQQVIADGATNYWRCNEVANATQLADSGSLNQGMFFVAGTGSNGNPQTGGPSPLLEQNDGGSVTFGQWSGSSGTSTMPYARSLAAIGFGAGAWSVEFWVLAPPYSSGGGINPNQGPNIMSQTNGGASANNWLISVGFGQLSFQIANNAGSLFSLNSAGPVITDGQWHHVVCTYDGTNMRSYVDGNLIGGPTAVTAPLSLSSADTVLFGSWWSGGGSPNSNLGGVSLAEISWHHSAALTATQVSNHFRLGVGFVNELGTGRRIGNIAKQIGWPAALQTLDTGVQNAAQNHQQLFATSALTFMQLVELTEGGAVFMDGFGRIIFLSRQTIATGTAYANVQATFGDQAADIPFTPGCDLAFDDTDIINQCVCTNAGSPVYQPRAQISNDNASQAAFRLRSKSLSGLLHQSDAAALAHAQWITNKLAQPVTRLRLIEIDMVSILSNVSKVASVLALDLLNRIVVERVQVGFSQTALIERIEEKITPTTWTIKLALSPTDTYATYSWGGAQ